MKLIELYDRSIAEGEIINNPLQRTIIEDLQQVKNAIEAPRSWFTLGKKQSQGIYLYGPVGGGKTYLMDLFYDNLPTGTKARFHFHQFMQQVDSQLRKLQGQKDPLKKIAASVVKKIKVLCFDEFLVFDVADAMILAELLQAILARNVVLVATSNTRPDDLYLGGVQRDRFIPAIELIKQHCKVIQLTENTDYRLGRAPLDNSYLYPLNNETEQKLTQIFEKIAPSYQSNVELLVQNRLIPCIRCAEKTSWFSFEVLCNLPRSQLDYLEIAERFDTIFLSNIPLLNEDNMVKTLLFIHLIDVLYDRGIQLFIAAAAPLDMLYSKGSLKTEFQRTLSRLNEMQSKDYLVRHQRRHLDEL